MLPPILDRVSDAVILMDLQGRILELNEGAAEIYGLPKSELVGRPLTEQRGVLSGVLRLAEDDAGEGGNTAEIAIEGAKGRVVHLEFLGGVVEGPGRDKAVLVLGRDITRRKESEAEVREDSGRLRELVEGLNRKLSEAERMVAIGQTTTMVGHDLRNPLQAIVNNLYLARKKLASSGFEGKENLEKRLDIIDHQIGFMDKIVADLQDFAGPVRPIPRETDVGMLVRDLLSTTRIPESVEASVEVEEGFPQLMVDPDLMPER
jgi:PAS domain S-box-containing protein